MTTTILRRLMLLLAAVCVMTGASMHSAEAKGKFLDKTRFVADVGVAYFAFHHWVSGPFKDGAFTTGAPHRTKSIVKAGLALLFAVNRVKKASSIAHNSKDPILQKLAGGLDAMGASFASIGQKFKSGSFNPSDVSSLSGAQNAFNMSALANHLPIKDVPVAIPGQ